jgi:hypothetical protein
MRFQVVVGPYQPYNPVEFSIEWGFAMVACSADARKYSQVKQS